MGQSWLRYIRPCLSSNRLIPFGFPRPRHEILKVTETISDSATDLRTLRLSALLLMKYEPMRFNHEHGYDIFDSELSHQLMELLLHLDSVELSALAQRKDIRVEMVATMRKCETKTQDCWTGARLDRNI